MKPSAPILIGLMLSFLVACTTPSRLPYRPALPDPAWTEQVPEPRLQGQTNRDLAAWTQALRQALAEANANLAVIKQWAEGLNGTP